MIDALRLILTRIKIWPSWLGSESTKSADDLKRIIAKEKIKSDWAGAVNRIYETPEEALQMIAQLLRQPGEIPQFARIMVAEMIDGQDGILPFKLHPRPIKALEHLIKKETEDWELAEKIKKEMEMAACSQEVAFDALKISRSTGQRALSSLKKRDQRIAELLASVKKPY